MGEAVCRRARAGAALAASAAVLVAVLVMPNASPSAHSVLLAASDAPRSITPGSALLVARARVPSERRGAVATAILAPPSSTDLEHPGQTVPSGQNESDPFLMVDGSLYFLYTSGIPSVGTHRAINIPVTLSTGTTRWSEVIDAMPVLPPWALRGFTWAPDVHRFGSHYVLYFTAAVAHSGEECIGAATGSSPIGPFRPGDEPFICQTGLGGSIDPRVFTDHEGIPWLLWKSDQNINGASTPTTMWSEQLTTDGLGLTGGPTSLMQPDRPWQGTVVEAPDMVEVDHDYWLTYSGNWFNQPDYAIGAALCAGPGGPCADPSPVPLLASNDQGFGPGEASIFAQGGALWLLYTPWYFPSHAATHVMQLSDEAARPVDITRIGVSVRGVYLAAGRLPPTLTVLPGRSPWLAIDR